MLLLSANTSDKQGSIALARTGEPPAADIEVIELVLLSSGAFSDQLVPNIASLLTRHGFGKTDIGAFAVAAGPGSFTGLRVGLAAIKALAEILNRPIASVSLLEVLAVNSGLQGTVLAALDAGRGEVYAGEYQIAGDSSRLVREELLTKEDFLHEAKKANLVTSDAGLGESARSAGLPVSLLEATNAGTIVNLAWRKIQRSETVSPAQLEANYIRRSDAEVFGKPRA
jgi:tRNA threonylcarbamoyladenosine biosynthesis protein TsaB